MSKLSDTARSLIVILGVFTLVVGGTYVVSMFARGYRYDFKNPAGFKATGLLSVTSLPKSASVYIDDRLVTATDDTINLPPGDYQIKIVKDGYLPWEKKASLKKEVVFQTNAELFRSVPDLKPITFSGSINPSINSDGTKIIYAVASASATRDNGLYLVEFSSNPLPITRTLPRQIATNFSNVDWSKFTFSFSPNSRQVLAKNATSNISYLLNIDSNITPASLFDVTPRLPVITEEWNQQELQIIQSKIQKLPENIRTLASTESAQNISLNSTDEKILFLAQTNGRLPDHIIPAPPAQSTQPQNRQIVSGNWYIYDLIDDTNFLIGSHQDIGTPLWLPGSNSVIYVKNQEIKVVEYDGTNTHTLFAGNFDNKLVYPNLDGGRLVTLYTPYTGAQSNLYAISIR